MTALTAAQHVRIRRQLALLPVYIWAIYIWRVFFAQFHLTGPAGAVHVFRDFVHFYIQGVVANERNLAALYDAQAQMALVPRYVPEVVNVAFPVVYGPQVALFFAPLARLPYLWALTVWLAVTLVLFLVSTGALWRACPRLAGLGWPVAALALASPAVHITMMYGQTTVLATACLVGAYLALRADRRFLAGLAIGMLVYKPQLGVAAAVVFIGAAEWAIVAGAVVSGALQLLAGLAYWGPAAFRDYWRVLGRLAEVIPALEPEPTHLHSLRASFMLLGLSPAVVTALTLIATAAILGLALWSWKRLAPLPAKFSVLILATALVNPHLVSYDLVLLTPALLLLWDHWRERAPSRGFTAWPGWALLVLLYLAPLFEGLVGHAPIQLSVWLQIALVLFVIKTSRHFPLPACFV